MVIKWKQFSNPLLHCATVFALPSHSICFSFVVLHYFFPFFSTLLSVFLLKGNISYFHSHTVCIFALILVCFLLNIHLSVLSTTHHFFLPCQKLNCTFIKRLLNAYQKVECILAYTVNAFEHNIIFPFKHFFLVSWQTFIIF